MNSRGTRFLHVAADGPAEAAVADGAEPDNAGNVNAKRGVERPCPNSLHAQPAYSQDFDSGMERGAA